MSEHKGMKWPWKKKPTHEYYVYLVREKKDGTILYEWPGKSFHDKKDADAWARRLCADNLWVNEDSYPGVRMRITDL